MVRFFRYSAWDGTQEAPLPDDDALMDALADDLIDHGDVSRALRNLFRRGMQSPDGQRLEGLQEMLERLRARRQQAMDRYDMDSVMEDLKQRLDEIVQTEREGIERRVDEARERLAREGTDEARERLLERLEEQAQRSRETLDNLPEGLGGAVQELSEYEFMDPEAARKFQELMDMLKGQMMDSMFQNMRQSLQGMGPQEMAALGEMLRALNEMIADFQGGGRPDFDGFMERFGQLFGPNPPRSLDELLEQMARQMSQMQSLMDSMSPEQRQELEGLMESLMDGAAAQEMAQLAQALEGLFPDLQRQYDFQGDDSLTLDQAMELMGQLGSMDELEQQIQELTRRGDLDQLDLEEIERLLGAEARRNLEQLQRIARMLEEAGYLQHNGERLELTPRGIRKIGDSALREVFLKLKKEFLGTHDVYTAGQSGEISGATRPYEFGESLDLDLKRTLLNAVSREGAGTPVRLTLQDLEVRETEHLTQTATCLLLDQSRSMGLYGSFLAAKRTSLALAALIQHHFARDILYIIGFSDYAIEIKAEDLPRVRWNAWMSGTNMHHALMLSRKLLSRHKNATRQVLMITDGEPTAHLEGSYSAFSYPPSYRTIQETLREAKHCTQEGITINTFMLEASHDLQSFIDKLTRINGGRAFYSAPNQLGQYVLVDYVSHRRKRLSG